MARVAPLIPTPPDAADASQAKPLPVRRLTAAAQTHFYTPGRRADVFTNIRRHVYVGRMYVRAELKTVHVAAGAEARRPPAHAAQAPPAPGDGVCEGGPQPGGRDARRCGKQKTKHCQPTSSRPTSCRRKTGTATTSLTTGSGEQSEPDVDHWTCITVLALPWRNQRTSAAHNNL